MKEVRLCDPPCPPYLCAQWSQLGWCGLSADLAQRVGGERLTPLPVKVVVEGNPGNSTEGL